MLTELASSILVISKVKRPLSKTFSQIGMHEIGSTSYYIRVLDMAKENTRKQQNEHDLEKINLPVAAASAVGFHHVLHPSAVQAALASAEGMALRSWGEHQT